MLPQINSPREAFDRKVERLRESRKPLAGGRFLRGHVSLGAILRIVAVAALIKLTAVMGLGNERYDAAVADMISGSPIQGVAGPLLRRGPVTRETTRRIYTARDAIGRALPRL